MKQVWKYLADGMRGLCPRWVRAAVRLPRRVRVYEQNMRADEKWRKEFNGWARHFGYAGGEWRVGEMEAACAIARRCAGAEEALKRLAASLEKEDAERPLPGLSPAEIERLALLAEECGEAVQAVGKTLRHGYQSASPFGGAINRVALEREMGDVRAAIQIMEHAGDVRGGDVKCWQTKKAVGVHKWMHHQ